MRTTLFIVLSALVVSCGGKSSGSGGENPPTPVVPPVPTDDVETCVKARANLTSDLSLLEAQLSNLTNAKDLAHGLLRASCSKN